MKIATVGGARVPSVHHWCELYALFRPCLDSLNSVAGALRSASVHSRSAAELSTPPGLRPSPQPAELAGTRGSSESREPEPHSLPQEHGCVALRCVLQGAASTPHSPAGRQRALRSRGHRPQSTGLTAKQRSFAGMRGQGPWRKPARPGFGTRTARTHGIDAIRQLPTVQNSGLPHTTTRTTW